MPVHKRILLVDDDEALIASLGAGLRDEGYAVSAAGNGEQALSALQDEHHDLVILDLMLPGMDGMAVCRMIRRSLPIPVIMLTAKGDDVDKVIGLEVGADDYITKPFNFRELLARIKSALRRPEMEGYATDEVVVVIGDLRVDMERREVRRGGQVVPLPLKEFELLALLARHPGRVFERDDLLARVWGDDFYGDEKTLDVHIRRLRAKIEPDPSDPTFIQTVRGVGYRMADAR